jgi:hypothetical protein
MFWVDWNALGKFDEVDGFEDGKALTDGRYTDSLESV